MPAVNEENLGAWVLKCNPQVWDLESFLADGNTIIDDWSTAENYRSAMMRYGQRVLFWVTGPAAGHLPRGLYGSGWVVGPVAAEVTIDEAGDEPEADPTEGDAGYWIDEEHRLRSRFFVPVEVELWESPVPAADFAHVAGLEGIEPLHAPQMSNPNWISVEQLAALEPFLPPWPELPTEVDRPISIGTRGAAFGDPVTNAVVEAEAMAAVEDYYIDQGWRVEDVSGDKVGWDLTCTRGSETNRVEVKGLSGPTPTVLLTANEHRAAREEPEWWLAVVTRALSAPSLTFYSAEQTLAAADPYVYRAPLGG